MFSLMMNFLLSLQFQHYVKDLSNPMHFRGVISNEQQDMGIIQGIPLYDFSELWIWSCTEQLKEKSKALSCTSCTLLS